MSELYILTEETHDVNHGGQKKGERKTFNLIGGPIGCQYEEGFKDTDGTSLSMPKFVVRGLTSTNDGYLYFAELRYRSGEHADPEASFRKVASALNKKGVLVNLSSFKVTKTASTKKETPVEDSKPPKDNKPPENPPEESTDSGN